MSDSSAAACLDLEKRLKSHDFVEEEDLISKLPDSIIIDQILSRLSDTKFSIRTGILSKRWKNLWQSVRSLYFCDFDFCKSAVDAFLDFGFHDKAFLEFYIFVDKAISQFQLESVNKFELNANYDDRFEWYVNKWIDFVVSRHVKQFNLYLMGVDEDNEYLLVSEAFYQNYHFTNIEIGYCALRPSIPIRWDNLTSLILSHLEFEEELISNVVSGSPMLKTLMFQSCLGSSINIRSNSVKDLILYGCQYNQYGNFVEINAPNISSLIIIGELWVSSIILRDVSSLEKAELNYQIYRFYEKIRKNDEEQMLLGFMADLKHIKELKVCCFCYPVSFYFILQMKSK
jgi:hypothetical protein